MKISDVEFVKSCLLPQDHPGGDYPEIAFLGRSNVGKSSALNVLVRRKSIAKISSTPGKTQMINYFRINRRFYFVDLPGYGYARVPREIQETWGRCITQYLVGSRHLKGVVVLVDGRHPPGKLDLEMARWLKSHDIAPVWLITKIDKINRGDRSKALRALRRALELDADEPLYPFSAKTGEGRESVWQVIEDLLSPPE